MPFSKRGAAAIICLCAMSSAGTAASPRDTLIRAAFATRDKAQAITLVDDALNQTRIALARDPKDREAQLQQALAIGYRGQLKRSLPDAKATLQQLDALAASDPRDAETQIAVGGWHLTGIADLGTFLARTVLGANKAQGLTAIDRGVALGGNRAFFPGYAALIRIRIDASDTAAALALAQRASTAATPTAIDRIMQRAAIHLLPALKAGDGATASKLAKQLLPFGGLG
ncbi:MAG: hypothetical protein JWO65_2349 [Sphingomonas bacterium]|jgi:hypothetical protein|nr:hypothetical protein [Sphingomonas bacterium]